jgi:hypothetical protein
VFVLARRVEVRLALVVTVVVAAAAGFVLLEGLTQL